jgi:hypothetical protein
MKHLVQRAMTTHSRSCSTRRYGCDGRCAFADRGDDAIATYHRVERTARRTVLLLGVTRTGIFLPAVRWNRTDNSVGRWIGSSREDEEDDFEAEFAPGAIRFAFAFMDPRTQSVTYCTVNGTDIATPMMGSTE